MMNKGERILRKKKKKKTNKMGQATSKLCLLRSKELDLQLASDSKIIGDNYIYYV